MFHFHIVYFHLESVRLLSIVHSIDQCMPVCVLFTVHVAFLVPKNGPKEHQIKKRCFPIVFPCLELEHAFRSIFSTVLFCASRFGRLFPQWKCHYGLDGSSYCWLACIARANQSSQLKREKERKRDGQRKNAGTPDSATI